MIRFTPLEHKYRSVDPNNPVDWIGITSLVSSFSEPFLPIPQSVKCSKNKNSKWFGMDPELIRSIWAGESKRSLDAGTWYHNREEDLISQGLTHDNLIVVKPTIIGTEKYAPIQNLQEGCIYPEHMVYLQSHEICGQSDRVESINSKVNIQDYKTAKTIKIEGYSNWEGITSRMLEPLTHLDECNFVHYSLQMSLYLYMILKHNPSLSPGKLTLQHIIFDIDHLDEYGYPIYKKDTQGFIIKEIKPYSIPYLKTEVISILNFLSENRDLVKERIQINKSN